MTHLPWVKTMFKDATCSVEGNVPEASGWELPSQHSSSTEVSGSEFETPPSSEKGEQYQLTCDDEWAWVANVVLMLLTKVDKDRWGDRNKNDLPLELCSVSCLPSFILIPAGDAVVDRGFIFETFFFPFSFCLNISKSPFLNTIWITLGLTAE